MTRQRRPADTTRKPLATQTHVLLGTVAIVLIAAACGSTTDEARVEELESQVEDLSSQLEDTTPSTAAPTTTTSATAPTTVPPSTQPPPPPTAPPTTASPPQGFLSFDDSTYYGQGGGSGGCSSWHIGAINNSDTDITQIVFEVPSADYTNFAEFNQETQQHAPPIAADTPPPVVLDVWIPSYGYQELAFQTCTATPPPANSNYSFGADAPSAVSYQWSTGDWGEACYHFGCP